MITFSKYIKVEVAGAYNNWTRAPMERSHEGWKLTVHGLKPNTLYRFKYIVDGDWRVDPSQPVDETEVIDGRPVQNNAIGDIFEFTTSYDQL
jgi:1,4-alpha-glucan branching enzyme